MVFQRGAELHDSISRAMTCFFRHAGKIHGCGNSIHFFTAPPPRDHMPKKTFNKDETAFLTPFIERFWDLRSDSQARHFIHTEVWPKYLQEHPLGQPPVAFTAPHAGETAEKLMSRWSDHRREVMPIPALCSGNWLTLCTQQVYHHIYYASCKFAPRASNPASRQATPDDSNSMMRNIKRSRKGIKRQKKVSALQAFSRLFYEEKGLEGRAVALALEGGEKTHVRHRTMAAQQAFSEASPEERAQVEEFLKQEAELRKKIEEEGITPEQRTECVAFDFDSPFFDKILS
jgi:hypothetical protein